MLQLDVTIDELTAWQDTPHVIPRADVILQVEGPGAVSCMQGLFTNDLERAGANSLTWGAVLTPKGMIITDLWVWRRETDLLLIVPELGTPPLVELLRKSFPPRLAKVTDLRDQQGAWWLTSGDPVVAPPTYRLDPSGPAPFRSIVVAPRNGTEFATDAVGGRMAPAVAADALALLAGWPVLGREIDARTLVQEVRFDALQAVRYDKGCYVGQETVSRLHFRGHPNRTLRAVCGRGAPPGDAMITGGAESRGVGMADTLLTCGTHWLASVKLRKEVADGERVRVGGHDGAVRQFPIRLTELL